MEGTGHPAPSMYTIRRCFGPRRYQPMNELFTGFPLRDKNAMVAVDRIELSTYGL